VIAQPPTHFDRASGALEGANPWERTVALLVTVSKISSHFSHRGYNGCANLLRKTLPERDIICEEHGDDPDHTVSRDILEQTPLELIVYDQRSNRMETVTELSILDRIKASPHVGYNVYGTASAFWQNRFDALNAKAARRVQ
jgi:hypothetical protein